MPELNNSNDSRSHARHISGVDVTVAIPGHPPVALKTANSSEGGVFLLYGVKDKPPIGTEITVILSEFLDSDDPLAMVAKVIHVNELGMGIEFLRPID